MPTEGLTRDRLQPLSFADEEYVQKPQKICHERGFQRSPCFFIDFQHQLCRTIVYIKL